MRGQCYDGASGKFRGVQERIRQIFPDAVYTHCKAHCLNLAIIHASEEPLARNMMNTVQEVAFMLNYSGKRLLRYQETFANDPESRAQMEHRTKLQSLCATRWAARADALTTFKCSYTTVVDSLDDLNLHYGDAKPGHIELRSLSSASSLVLWLSSMCYLGWYHCPRCYITKPPNWLKP